MHFHAFSIVASILFVALPIFLGAQDTIKLVPGDRVRVTAPTIGLIESERSLASNAEGVLTLISDRRVDPRLVIPMTQITRLDVRRAGTRRETGKGVGIGAGVGAILFGVGGYFATRCPPTCQNGGEYRSGLGTLLLLPGSAIGALIGGIVGHNTTAHEWKPVYLPPK